LCAESVLDIAAHVIADSGLRTPTTHRESFQIRAESGVLGGTLAKQMERWASLRNVLVHLYLEVDHNILFDILKDDLGQLSWIRYEGGWTSYLEVLDVQRSLLGAQLAASEVLRLRRTLMVQLYKALGGGWTPLAVAQNAGTPN